MTTIDKLTTAILDGDIKAVRQIIKTDPSLGKQKTRANQFPIELARDKGLKRIEAILLLNSDNDKQFYRDKELSDFIGYLISELSEDIYSAGWAEGIERELWCRSEVSTSIQMKTRVVSTKMKLMNYEHWRTNWAIGPFGTTAATRAI